MDRIKELRKRNNLSQADVAARLQVARSTVSMWETGHSGVDNENLIKLAAMFHVSVDYLLGVTDEPLEDGADAHLPAKNAQDYQNIRMIERAQRNMSAAEKDRMMRILKASFEDYFKDDDETST